MSFRQKPGKLSSTTDEWTLWLRQNADLIEASGLPSLVLSDKAHWYDFLEHGRLLHCNDDPSGFHVGQLSLRQKAALLRLLRTWPSLLQTEVAEGLTLDMISAVEKMAPD